MTNAIFARCVFKQHEYPPKRLLNVPQDCDSLDAKRRYCERKFPYWFPSGGLVTYTPTDQSMSDLCLFHRMANFPASWKEDFNPFARNYAAWNLAALILRLEDLNIDCVLRDIKFGDESGWLQQPLQNMVFCQQAPPESALALEELILAFKKNLIGKQGDVAKGDCSSILDGPSLVPLALQHAPMWAIPKGPTFQVIFDGSNRTNRLVIEQNDVSLTHKCNVVSSVINMRITFPGGTTKDHIANAPLNSLQPPECLLKVTAVNYTNLKHIRQCFRKWKTIHTSYIDLSSAYNHGKCNAIFGQMLGAQLGDMFFRFNAFSFGAARSCVAFQQFTSVICHLAKVLSKGLFSIRNQQLAT